MLVSPFEYTSDFDIQLRSNLTDKKEKVNISRLGNYYEVKLSGFLTLEPKELTYEIWNRKAGSSKRIKNVKQTISLRQLITDSEENSSLLDTKVGSIKVDLLFYPRNERTVMDSNFKLTELNEYLKENAGIKIYRDNIRVKPYGELDQPGGDWLNLGSRFAQNPAGRSRANHRIRPSQLVGAISIGRDNNPELSDSASREGLIQGDSFRLLREIVIGAIRLVEACSHEIFVNEEKLRLKDEEDAIDRNLEAVNNKLETVRDDLQTISKSLSNNRDPEIKTLGENVAAIVSKITYISESVEVLESQTRLYRGLATIGIASAVFGHETQIQISRIVGAVNMAKDFLMQSPPQVDNSISKMKTAIEASDNVLAWGGFALDRIRRDKRERNKENISKPIMRIVTELRRALEAVDILIIDNSLDQSIESRIFPIDIETIILNLLTNAYTACKQVNKNRKIKINLYKSTKNKRKGYMITVSDSGPGVNEKLRSIIWEPTFTTKTTKKGASEEGTGMGLAIIDGIVEEMNGTKKVDDDPELGGAIFEIWLPIVQ
jgi:signal transduction histidine kinase